MFNTIWLFFTNMIDVMGQCSNVLTWGIKGTPFNVLTIFSVGGFLFIIGWKIYHFLNPVA